MIYRDQAGIVFLGLRISGGTYPWWLNVLALISIILVTYAIPVIVGWNVYSDYFHPNDPLYLYDHKPWFVQWAYTAGMIGAPLFFLAGLLGSRYDKGNPD